ncbi:MAG: tetrahydrofolate dehydrogenase/cyclohydrolase catalytic domain-containing protein, partial [Rhodothermales bacterium]
MSEATPTAQNEDTVTDNLIDGRAVAADVRSDVREEVSAWTSKGNRPPSLAVVLVGDNPASASYVRGKMKASTEVGIDSTTLRRDSSVTEDELVGMVQDLN